MPVSSRLRWLVTTGGSPVVGSTAGEPPAVTVLGIALEITFRMRTIMALNKNCDGMTRRDCLKLGLGAPPRIPVGCGAFVSFHPSLGSVTAHERGAPAGLPAYFSMPSMSRSGGPNFLGARYAPFVVADNPNSPDFQVRDVALPRGLSGERFLARRDIRQEIDTLQRIADPAAGDPALALD